MSAKQSTAEVTQRAIAVSLRAIGAIFVPGDVIEIRALDVGRNESHAGCTHGGYFNFENSSAIAAALNSVDGRSEGVYVVLNRINPDLIARSCNRLRPKLKNTTSDADIVERRWLYIDADAKRPAGISATDAEHEAALRRITLIRDSLQELGWPEPIHGDSGNGGHLLYRLPELEVTRAGGLVKGCLKALSARFSDHVVTVDESTANAARLCKLYGTMVRKGDSTADRPHRRSALIETPERIEAVSLEKLEALASEVKAQAATARERASCKSGFDIDHWLDQSGLDIIKGPEPYDNGRRWTLAKCPFNPEHSNPAVIQLANGALVYNCFHKSCTENDWKELRRLKEPGCRDDREPIGRLKAGSGFDCSTDIPLITDLSQLPSVYSLESQLDWCVDGMIAEASITLICAESGTGKTWLGYYLAGCVANGLPVVGLGVRRCKVLYLDGENPLYVTKQRLFDLGISDTPDLIIWGSWNLSPPVGPENNLIVEFARDHRGVVIYDSLIEFHPGSEQSSTETRAFMRFFRKLASLGATVIILHHTGKADTAKQYRGSSDIKAAVDTAYLLTRKSQDSAEIGELSMACFKARLAPGRHFGMRFAKGVGFEPCESFSAVRSATEIITEILEAHPARNQKQIVQLASEQGCAKGQVEKCLKSGDWATEKGPNNSTLYSLPGEGAEDDRLDS